MAGTRLGTRTRPLHSRLSLAIKSLRFMALVALAVVVAPGVGLLGARAIRVIRWWYGRVLGVLGVRLAIDGQSPAGPQLIVANHCSWLDILVLGHVFDAAFVSKSEIGGWPLIGRYARAAGTLFLTRGAGQGGETTNQILSVLKSGHSVLLFPEGTTLANLRPKRFHARLFAAAIDGGYPVLPVALRYCDETTPADMHHALAPWTEKRLWPHFRDLFRLRYLRAQLRLCPPLYPGGHSRRGLAQAAQRAIDHRQMGVYSLGVPAPPGTSCPSGGRLRAAK
jgi:1-acyl-sn-glycerol-3-phosphate acyltransferase